MPSGFEMEYTQPLSAATAAARWPRSTRSSSGGTCRPPGYGGPKVDEETLSVTSATLSADGQKVTLAISGLQAGRVVHVRSPRPFTSSTGQSLWSTEAWYTLNAIPGGTSQTNLALGRAATADWSCATTEGPAKAVNGSVTRRQPRQVVLARRDQVAAGRPRRQPNINQFVVKHAGAGGENAAWNTRDFTIQVGTNGTTWTTVATVTGNTAAPPRTTSPRSRPDTCG